MHHRCARLAAFALALGGLALGACPRGQGEDAETADAAAEAPIDFLAVGPGGKIHPAPGPAAPVPPPTAPAVPALPAPAAAEPTPLAPAPPAPAATAPVDAAPPQAEPAPAPLLPAAPPDPESAQAKSATGADPVPSPSDGGEPLDAEPPDLDISFDVESYRAPKEGFNPADFGWLTVISEPRGVPVELADPGFPLKTIGETPIEGFRLIPGKYEIAIRTKCHFPVVDTFRVERGEKRRFVLELEPRRGKLRVSAVNRRGQPVKADVFVDGERVGRSPGTFEVPICASELRVRHARHGEARRTVYVKERGVTRARVQLR